MGVTVVEHYGQRTDVDFPIIKPIHDSNAKCPFSAGNTCKKLKSQKHPVCSVRKPDGTLWIVCSDRLCATKDIPLKASSLLRAVLCSVSKLKARCAFRRNSCFHLRTMLGVRLNSAQMALNSLSPWMMFKTILNDKNNFSLLLKFPKLLFRPVFFP